MANAQEVNQNEIKYAAVSASAATTTIVAAVAGKRIRLISAWLVNTTGQNVTFQSSTGSTALSGAAALPATGVVTLPYNEGGWLETASGASLQLVLSGPTLVAGTVSYIEVTI